jgi:hypothetical protein
MVAAVHWRPGGPRRTDRRVVNDCRVADRLQGDQERPVDRSAVPFCLDDPLKVDQEGDHPKELTRAKSFRELLMTVLAELQRAFPKVPEPLRLSRAGRRLRLRLRR